MSDWLLPLVRDWDDWRPIFTDVALWRPVVERVWAADATLQASTGIAAPGRVEAGYPGTCAVFVVDDAAVIKFFPPMVAPDYRRELTTYRLIDERVPHLPRLLTQGAYHDRIEWPYLAVAFLSGEAWRDAEARIDPVSQIAIISELGRTVRALHDVPLPVSGPWPSMSDWEILTARMPQAMVELRERTNLSGRVVAEIEALLAATDWFTVRPCLLHADLTEDHLLVGEQNGRWGITGLIDWADAEVGDPFYEWVALWFSICRRDVTLFRAFLEGYDPALRPETMATERLIAFTFLHRFGVGILADTLSAEQQAVIDSMAELERVLFPGLGDL
jgi:hygromycin-B 7''-O-kinase